MIRWTNTDITPGMSSCPAGRTTKGTVHTSPEMQGLLQNFKTTSCISKIDVSSSLESGTVKIFITNVAVQGSLRNNVWNSMVCMHKIYAIKLTDDCFFLSTNWIACVGYLWRSMRSWLVENLPCLYWIPKLFWRGRSLLALIRLILFYLTSAKSL